VLADPVFGKSDPRVSPTASGAGVEVVAGNLLPAARDAPALRSGENFPRLPATLEEAEAIQRATGGAAKVLTGFAATREAAVNGDLGRYPVLHFATHGVVDRSHPELSGLLLSTVNERGASENGFLQLHDIYSLKLSARLVVLSACGTGLGKEMPGEGLVGMTQGFMYAGSESVVASLWKVDDKATAALMSHFYEGMFREGLPPSAALREAKAKIRLERRWRSPYYWAAFTLQGEYRGGVGAAPAPRHSRASALIALALLVPASAAALHLARRARRIRRAGR
jgi:CHAT domain-containing protein